MSQVQNFGLIVIGDEILSGRRRDRHFDGIGALLREFGFDLAWLRILPDDPTYITAELRHTMAEGIPVFCCGGIGATPDDYTRACAADAAGVALTRNPAAVAEIEARFGAEAYPLRVRMADLPAGSALIPNPYNRIPGFSLHHHYFMPGFPDMAHPMARWVIATYYAAGGVPEQSMSVRVSVATETDLMPIMADMVARFPAVKLFSLPRLGDERFVELGFHGRGDLQIPFNALRTALDRSGFRYTLEN